MGFYILCVLAKYPTTINSNSCVLAKYPTTANGNSKYVLDYNNKNWLTHQRDCEC